MYIMSILLEVNSMAEWGFSLDLATGLCGGKLNSNKLHSV